MNTKKSKHKKPNKPSNPNPPQKLEKDVKSDLQKVQSSEVKIEETVKEIISEVVEAPVSETFETQAVESDTPKKPKRNKGKKKKQDQDDDFIEKVDESAKVQTESDALVQMSKEITAEEKDDEETKDALESAAIVPSARKKKNKKKNQENPVESSGISSVALELPPEVAVKVSEEVSPEIKELDTLKQDNKKKNKKKKQNDSEKSENVSCTLAFQKLFVEDEIDIAEKLDVVECQNPNDEASEENMNENPIAKITSVQETEIKQTAKDDHKSKKKNKKDKKHILIDEPKLTTPGYPNTSVDDLLLSNVLPDEKQVLMEPMEKVLQIIEEEPSPKSKAKIAKPVERKQKHDSVPVTEPSQSISEERAKIELIEKQDINIVAGTEVIVDVPIQAVLQPHDAEQLMKQATNVLQDTLTIIAPANNKMGKKRKKSPRPQKKEETLNIKENVSESSHNIPSVEPTLKDVLRTADRSIPLQSQIMPEIKETELEVRTDKFDLVQVDTQIKTEEILPILPINTTHIEIEMPPTVINPVIATEPLPNIKTEEEGFEVKTNKKKKKIPNIPKQSEDSAQLNSQVLMEEKVKDSQEKSSTIEEKIDFPLDVSISSELEVRSLRTDESGSSTCENTPDVVFIRSSSQQLFDTNNNTVIQELVSVEEIKLSSPIPFIECSGETPIHTPELIEIKMSEFEAKPVVEKTDIKSKMIEVNQDMEDLRLSIERSLAEFTALDKCEQQIDTKQSKSLLVTESEPVIRREIIEESNIKQECIKMPDIRKESDIPIGTNITLSEQSNITASKQIDVIPSIESPPICPTRKDNKGKNKSKKKGRQETAQTATSSTSASTASQSKNTEEKPKEEKQETQKSQQKSESSKAKGKPQSDAMTDKENTGMIEETNDELAVTQEEFEPIENFEDALTSSIDDVNQTFEMIAKDADNDNKESQRILAANKPKINVSLPSEETDVKRNEKTNPVSQPKNLLGHYDIPVQSNKTDYKKEKNKTPNARQAKVKIKDSIDIENKKQSKESQTDAKSNKKYADKPAKEYFSKVKNDSEEYVYKYSFRKVFLQSACNTCNKELGQMRVPCAYCNLVFYCGARHKDEDWPHHQALCFAVSTIAHMKDQKHIYADALQLAGQDYRLLRMQAILAVEKVLKRRLVPWEQEALLYPRVCADVACRQWRQNKLRDCEGCGQLSYCSEHPDHLPKSHQRWCKSYCLYQKLVSYQQTKGRLEPRLPTKVMAGRYEVPSKMNEVLAALYEEKIDMNDIQYAALTQLATAPLTAAHCLQLCRGKPHAVYKNESLTIHILNAELQFEADSLNKWEVFFLHLYPHRQLRVVMVSADLNPGGLPLDLLANVRMCDQCRRNSRRVTFSFVDNSNYSEYCSSDDYIHPDVICAFNQNINRSSVYNGRDPWPGSLTSILRSKQPFIITSYTLNELRKDVAKIKERADNFKLILEPSFNNFASVRPDRNFISDDEIPLLFKNYCVAVVVGC